MQFFVDIDGVLLNFERAFVAFLNRAYGMTLPERYETESWFFEELMSPQEMHERWQAFLESEDAGRMEPLVEPGRFNALTAGQPVHLLTNFPEPFMEKRKANLAALGFVYDSLDFCGLHPYRDKVPPSKGAIVARMREPARDAFFIDDHPDNCLDVLKRCEGVEVWVMTRFFNREFAHPRVHRARDWACIFERLSPTDGSSTAGQPT